MCGSTFIKSIIIILYKDVIYYKYYIFIFSEYKYPSVNVWGHSHYINYLILYKYIYIFIIFVILIPTDLLLLPVCTSCSILVERLDVLVKLSVCVKVCIVPDRSPLLSPSPG